ncbi:MAG: transposase [Planctomycetaceae bacterium]
MHSLFVQTLQAHADTMEAEGRSHRTNPDDAVPDAKAQRNFTDPESKIIKTSNKGFDQCDNAQIVVSEDQIILAADVTNQSNDVRQVTSMVEQMKSNVKAVGVTGKTKDFLADAGYFSEDNVNTVTSAKMNAFIATQRLKHNEQIPPCPKGRIPAYLTAKQRVARRLRTRKGRATYSKRKWMVEPVFGRTKACRGFRQFLLRSLKKM